MKEKCKVCGRCKGYHKSGTFNCPIGMRSRVGYLNFHPKNVFLAKASKKGKS
jgi:hypothetical protein